MYQSHVDGESTEKVKKAWDWETNLFGGWPDGRTAWSEPNFRGTWMDRVATIILRAPNSGVGRGAYCEMDDHEIVRIVEGQLGWEGVLPLVDAGVQWTENDLRALRRTGPWWPDRSCRAREEFAASGGRWVTGMSCVSTIP